jgi:hypothetical protein
MRRLIGMLAVGAVGLSLGLAAPAIAGAKECPPDSVQSGTICIDRYEASVWTTTNAGLIKKIKDGKVTQVDLIAAGAIQLGLLFGDLVAAGCPSTGNGCVDVYAVSIPGVTPSTLMTWFQAAAAARNAGKRLPSNAEWQVAALGTPDGAPCIVNGGGPPRPTGTAGCVSDVGAFDMVGNVWEWVADWVPLPTACPGWGGFSDDSMCLAGASTTGGPAALIRGGDFFSGALAGVFAVTGFNPTLPFNDFIGFRAAR